MQTLFVGQFFVYFVFLSSKFFGLSKEFFSNIREGTRKSCVSRFAEEVIAEGLGRFLGIEDERILSFFLKERIVAIEVPVTGFYGAFISF